MVAVASSAAGRDAGSATIDRASGFARLLHPLAKPSHAYANE
jgi:hypothetical protein